jgi:hypothetical protein
MCTGHSPFRAETMMGVLRRICEDEPRSVRQVNPDVSEWLADAIDRLLAKRPAERFQTAEELAEQLGRYLAYLQQPTHFAKPAPLGKRRAKRRLLVPGAIVTLAIAVLASWVAWGRMQPDVANHPRSRRERQQGAPTAGAASPDTVRTDRLGLAEWNRFEQELNAARRQTDELEWQLRRSVDDEPQLADPLPELRAEIDAVEQNLNAPP